ncbi:hypothetical protein [Sphingobium sp. MP9-4]|uniref:hypothetical protein n=1 Tax=Sphingobium sp. MP9-4 TaxID=1761936 RepID=UPI0019D000C6|nr:hypothetical protein [Sphingobium sp. MP9-4]
MFIRLLCRFSMSWNGKRPARDRHFDTLVYFTDFCDTRRMGKRLKMYEEMLRKSMETRSARATEHARKAFDVLERLYDLTDLFDKVENLNLALLTKILNKSGIKSPTGKKLKSTTVSRMFIHLGMTWQGFVTILYEHRAAVQMIENASHDYDDAAANARLKSNADKVERVLAKRRMDALDINWLLFNEKGDRIGVKEYFRLVRRGKRVTTEYKSKPNNALVVGDRLSKISPAFEKAKLINQMAYNAREYAMLLAERDRLLRSQ